MNAKVIGIFLLLVVLCLFLAFNTDGAFLKGNNIENLIRRTSMYGILGIGVAFVIITSGIDLSIGSIVCLSGCLLAIFLRVDYEPLVGHEIVQVKAAAKQILLAPNVDAFEPGDTIRYYGGRRARTAVVTIDSVKQTTVQMGTAERPIERDVTQLTVSDPLSRNDTDGNVALMYPISSSEQANSAESPQITISGTHALAARDRVMLVSGSQLKELQIIAAKVDGASTTLTLNNPTGDLDDSWMVIPLERRQRCSIPVAVSLVVGTAAFLGLLHGVLITRLRLPPFIVTLCGLLVYRSLSRWMVNDKTMGFGTEFSESLSLLGSGKIQVWQSADGADSFGIPYPFFVFLITAIVAAIFLNKTIWGRYTLALGRNEDAARYSGIDTGKITVISYVICAVLAGIGGMLFALDSNSVMPSTFGNVFELYAIAAAVLGGCSLRGGEGGILGVVIGTALMQTLYNLIVLMRISDTLELAVIGTVILVGVVADEVVRRVVAKRRAADQAKRQMAAAA
ncbi:MAG: ABC transporter permease [Planctomycetales bacterium]|nr:ABC transporter permease [Planctomycetales bacterium]